LSSHLQDGGIGTPALLERLQQAAGGGGGLDVLSGVLSLHAGVMVREPWLLHQGKLLFGCVAFGWSGTFLFGKACCTELDRDRKLACNIQLA